jgi:hypothetical protein
MNLIQMAPTFYPTRSKLSPILPQRRRTPYHIAEGVRTTNPRFIASTAVKLGKNGVHEEAFERAKERECSAPYFSGFYLFNEE